MNVHRGPIMTAPRNDPCCNLCNGLVLAAQQLSQTLQRVLV